MPRRRPTAVPADYRATFRRLSKSSLMEIAWDLARSTLGGDGTTNAAAVEIIMKRHQYLDQLRDTPATGR